MTACRLEGLGRHITRSKSISFIGLGRMGSEMAFNLFSKTCAVSKDSQLVVCDAMPDAVHSFRQKLLSLFPTARLRVAATPEEYARSLLTTDSVFTHLNRAVQWSRTVITMLPSSPQVRTVYSESAGIVPTLRSLPEEVARDTLCIDSTTLDVEVARQVAHNMSQTGARMTDAPVSGGTRALPAHPSRPFCSDDNSRSGVAGAKAGTLTFLVGGTTEAYELSQPFLSWMGKRIIHCGPSGSGLVAKICNNLILGVEQIVVAEAMLLGQKLGLDPAVLAGVINSSTGGCWASSNNNPVPRALPDKKPPCENDYEGGFATALMLKVRSWSRRHTRIACADDGRFHEKRTWVSRVTLQRRSRFPCRWEKRLRASTRRL
jgi:3-hydroxyisobutyrate dehydrogenase